VQNTVTDYQYCRKQRELGNIKKRAEIKIEMEIVNV
jgi:hypothetical protein